MRPERLTRVRTCGAGHHRPVPSPSQLRGRLSAKKSVKSQGLGDRVPYSKATFLSKKTVDKRVGSPRPQPGPLAGLEARPGVALGSGDSPVRPQVAVPGPS